MANLQLSIDTNAMTLSIERLAGPLGLIKAASEDSEMALRFATPLSDLSEALVAAGLISRVEGTAGALKLVPTPAFAAFVALVEALAQQVRDGTGVPACELCCGGVR